MIRTNHVKAWMVRKGMIQEDVAQAAGVSRPMVSFFLNGKKRSPRLTAWFINQGCPVRYLGEAAKYGREAA